MKVTVRVAVKMGRAVGVTVSTNPPSARRRRAASTARCAACSGPSAPKTDFVTTSY